MTCFFLKEKADKKNFSAYGGACLPVGLLAR